MAVVGTAEIVIVPVLKKFGDIGTQIGKQLDGVGLAAAGTAGQFAIAEKSAASAASELGAAGLAAAGTGGKLASAGEDAGKLEGGLGRTRLAATAARDGLKDAESSVASFGSRLGTVGATASGAFGGMLGSVKSFALEATKLGALFGVAGVAGAIYEGTKKANEFEAEMAKLGTQAGATSAEIAEMSPAVLNLAQSVGIGPTGLAEGLYHLESAGFRGSEALDLLTAAAKEAKIGHADLEKTVQASIAVEASHIKGVNGAADAMGLLNKIVGVGDTRMEDLASSMSSGIVPTAATFGLSMQDVGASMATLTDNAIPAQEAATRLRMTFSLLGAPSLTAQKALASIGVGSTQLGNDMRKPNGLLVALQDLKGHLEASGMSATDQAAVISRAFGGGKSSSAIMTLLSQMDRLQGKYTQLETGGMSSAAQFDKAWSDTQQTTSQKLATLRGSFDALLVKVGESTRGAQGSLASFGSKAVGAVSRGIDAVGAANKARSSGGPVPVQSPDMQKLTKVLGDVYKAADSAKKIFVEIEPALKNIGKAAAGVVAVGIHVIADVLKEISDHGSLARDLVYGIAGAFTAYKIAMLAAAAAEKVMAAATWLLDTALDANPVMLVVIAIAALVAGAILAYRHVGWFRDAVNAVGRALKDAAMWVAHMSETIWHGLVDAFHAVVNAGESVWHAVDKAFRAVVDAGKSVGRGLSSAFHGVEDATKSVGRFFSRMYDDVKHWLGVALDFVKKWAPLIAIVMSGGLLLIPVLVAKYWRQIYDFTVRIFTDVKNFIVRIFDDVKNGVMAAVNAVVDFFERHWRLILVIATGVTGLLIVLIVNNWSRITGLFKAGWEAVSGFMSRMWHDVAGAFSSMWHEVSDIASRIWRDVAGAFTSLGRSIADIATKAWHEVANAFSSAGREVAGIATRLWHDVADAFTSLWRDASNLGSRIWHDVAGAITSLWHEAVNLAGRIWHDVASPIESLWHEASTAVSSLWHEVVSALSNLWRDATGLAGRIWHETSAPFVSLWHEMSTTASNLWKDVTGWFERIKNDITNSVKTATGWIKGAWDGLKDIFKAPINFLISPVFNKGILPVWNAFAPIVHESKMEPVSQFAEGGPITGGRAGRDSVPALLMPGEHVWTAAEVAAAGGQKAMFALRRLFGGGTQAPGAAMAGGGIPGGGVLGAIADAVTDPLGTLKALGEGTIDVIGTAVHWVRGALADAAQTAFTPIRAIVASTLGTGEDWKGAAGRLAESPMDAIVNLLRGQDKTDQAAAAQAAASAGGAARWAPVMTAALAQAGQSASWLSLGLQRMNQESGGDPNAVNRWDSNWTAGHPSVGLMQLINSTFAAYAGPYRNTGPFSYGVSTDPMANVYASIKYTDARYGSLSAWGRPGGYDTGGGKAWPTGTLGYNLSGETEYVWKGSQLAGMSTATTRGGTTNTFHVAVDARGSTDPAATERAVRRGVADALATLDQMLQQGVGGGS
ncbi:phage tail tape measure protein [Frankia sp. R82]|uniref:phage tail tape measure protein n=1 Tax=Frankia sp. R82 TaxID=2950553 RepID=UPI0020438F13|nr:phage tail tape measure protein [Frankia sp. R82]MCM3886129.1 phage tail tape measure protein [Frankia sp. R82]